jgi:CxxC-x17-CxxC domain-containing protein
MAFSDKTLTCADCNAEFTFTANEQEFYATKGFSNEPKRCPDCRQSRKSGRNSGGGGSRSARASGGSIFKAVCAACGKDTLVPFEPKLDRPVYCSACYSAVRSKER